MNKILVITADVVGDNMAGPAIRAVEIARFLSDFFPVTLCARVGEDSTGQGYELIDISRAREVIPKADVIIGHGLFFHKYPFKRREDQKLIIDLYNIFLTENAFCYRVYDRARQAFSYQLDLYKLNYQLMLGDHFLCANTSQFNFISGMLTALNRVNVSNMGKPPLSIIPFGTHDAPCKTREVLKGVYPGIKREDRVLLWGGGVWDWLDPITMVKAMKIITEKKKSIKLFFMGIKSPNPDVIINKREELFALTENLGLLNSSVFFNSWVPYGERHNFLLESDIGVSLHLETQETRYSNRTRVLDYLWASLPIISTKGGSLSELISSHHLGSLVGYQNEEEVAEAVLAMLYDEKRYQEYRKNLNSIKGNYTWKRVLRPLKALCENRGMNRGEPYPRIPFTVGESIRLNRFHLLKSGIKARGGNWLFWKSLEILTGFKRRS